MSTPSAAELPEVLTAKEVAQILRCSRQHVSELVKREEIPYFKIGTRSLRFDRDVLLEHIARRSASAVRAAS